MARGLHFYFSRGAMITAQPRGPTVLLIEDDVSLASMLTEALGRRDYAVWHIERGGDAEAALDQLHVDLILLDVMLPDHNGLLICGRLKARTGAPIIICSATRRKDDAALSLQLGADDFLHKPFSLDELEARIELALRRRPVAASERPRPGDQIDRMGALTIDRCACVATVGESPLPLTPTEFRLLSALSGHPGEVISRVTLAERVWDSVDEGVLRSLDVHMRRLRAKLSSAADGAPQLVTRRGFGYQLIEALDDVRQPSCARVAGGNR